MFERIEAIVTRFAAAIAIIGGLGLLFAIVTTCVSVLLKTSRRIADQFFQSATVGEMLPWLRSILGEEELVTYGVGLAIFASLPWVMLQKGHIKVDFFKPIFGERLNRVLDLAGDLCITLIAFLILTRQWNLVFKPPRRNQDSFFELILSGEFATALGRLNNIEESQILAIPLWPSYVVAQTCVLAFFLVSLFCVWRSVRHAYSAT